MNIQYSTNILWRMLYGIGALLAIGGMLASCTTGDDLANDGPAHSSAAVSFSVSDAQNDGLNPMSRAAFSRQLATEGIVPADLAHGVLAAHSSDGGAACLIESTVAGINPVIASGAATRAGQSEAALPGDFSTTAFRGGSSESIGEAWFADAETKPDGTLINPQWWERKKPYGKFYAVYPHTAAGEAPKLTTDEGSPYVDFTVAADVSKQVDFMTDTSVATHYEVGIDAPHVALRFHHALTAVRFKVGSNLSYNKTITKIEIIGAKNKARYTLPPTDAAGAGSWNVSSDAATTTFTLDNLSMSTNEANSVVTGNGNCNCTFYMIPQQLDGVSMRVSFGDNSTITANLKGEWKAGTTKTYALSEKNSNWEYVFNVEPPQAIAYNQTAATYKVTSYRKVGDTQQPVAWKVVGYDGNGDGNYSLDDKPDWLSSLDMSGGEGGTEAAVGSATLKTEALQDLLAKRNETLVKAKVKGAEGDPYDLSTHTYNGIQTTMNTANSYLISAPGYYKIPLVYGNAIKDGHDNPSSYKTKNTGARILSTFKDHNGKEIASPYINVQNGDKPATQACIVWTDQSGIVEECSLAVTGGGNTSYVRFHVPADKIKNGNAVIAVKDASNTIMWSWHLWFAPQDALNTTEVTNYQKVKYNFTNETLGWKYTEWQGTTYRSPRSVKVKVEQTVGQAGKKQVGYITITQKNYNQRKGYSTLYQFGRKDAMPGTDNIQGFTQNGGDNMSIQNGIQNPGTFYTGNSWNTDYSQYNLWSMDNTVTGYNDNAVVKTIYDPCPVGFHMPASNAITGFSATGGTTPAMNTRSPIPMLLYISPLRDIVVTAAVRLYMWVSKAATGWPSHSARATGGVTCNSPSGTLT